MKITTKIQERKLSQNYYSILRKKFVCYKYKEQWIRLPFRSKKIFKKGDKVLVDIVLVVE